MHERYHVKANCLRLEPEKRLCPTVDSTGIRMYRIATSEEMGMRVMDDFCQEHIQ